MNDQTIYKTVTIDNSLRKTVEDFVFGYVQLLRAMGNSTVLPLDGLAVAKAAAWNHGRGTVLVIPDEVYQSMYTAVLHRLELEEDE